MSTTKNPALRNAIERHARVCQHSKVARHILDADCCHEDNAFALFSLPRKLPGLFTVRFTAPADFTAGDIVTLKGREFTIKTRTMEEPSGKLFSAGAVVLCEIDMERNLAFVTMGGEVQIIGGNLGDALPEMDGAASAGSSTNVSREDHVHPTDMSRAPASLEISTEAPLTGGGDLTASRTIGISPATAATATAAGTAGSVVYAPDNAGPDVRDQSATPAMVHALAVAGGGGISLRYSQTTTGNITVTGLTPYKPVFIFFYSQVTTDKYATFYVVSGEQFPRKQQFLLGLSTYVRAQSEILMPSGTSIAINVTAIGSDCALRFYQ